MVAVVAATSSMRAAAVAGGGLRPNWPASWRALISGRPVQLPLEPGRAPVVHATGEFLYAVVEDDMEVPHVSRLRKVEGPWRMECRGGGRKVVSMPTE